MSTGRPVNPTNPIRSGGKKPGWFGYSGWFRFYNSKQDEIGLGIGFANTKLEGTDPIQGYNFQLKYYCTQQTNGKKRVPSLSSFIFTHCTSMTALQQQLPLPLFADFNLLPPIEHSPNASVFAAMVEPSTKMASSAYFSHRCDADAFLCRN